MKTKMKIHPRLVNRSSLHISRPPLGVLTDLVHLPRPDSIRLYAFHLFLVFNPSFTGSLVHISGKDLCRLHISFILSLWARSNDLFLSCSHISALFNRTWVDVSSRQGQSLERSRFISLWHLWHLLGLFPFALQLRYIIIISPKQ